MAVVALLEKTFGLLIAGTGDEAAHFHKEKLGASVGGSVYFADGHNAVVFGVDVGVAGGPDVVI